MDLDARQQARKDKYDHKKGIIAAALRELLSERGYAQVTIQDVADEAGYSKGGVLHYFPNKSAIYIALIDDIYHEMAEGHLSLRDSAMSEVAIAPVSALYGIEQFVMDRKNAKVIINLLMYALEDEMVRLHIRKYLKIHREYYKSIIDNSRQERPSRRKSDLGSSSLARAAQTILLFMGIMEVIDPASLNHEDLLVFVTSLLKG